MPGAVADADQPDQVKVYKTEDEIETSAPSAVLFEDKREITFQAGLESSATATSSASGAHKMPDGAAIGSKAPTAFSPTKPTSAAQQQSAADHSAALNGLAQNIALSQAAAAAGGYIFWPYHGAALLGQSYPLPLNPATAPGSPFAALLPNGRFPLPAPAHSAGLNGLAALSLDGKTASPTFVSPYFSAPHGLSPSYADQLSLFNSAALAARFSPMMTAAASPANLSPIHSPATGTPIAPLSQAAAKEAELNMLRNHLSATSVPLQSSMQLRMLGNPLASMAQLRLPSVTTTVTSFANSLATSSAAHHSHAQQMARAAHERVARPGEPKKEHIKKPLNAFMIFMKRNREKLIAEKGYKEKQSAELNKELGRLWHTLTHEQQQEYYAIAKDERQKHAQKYPGWTARDNYAINKKKKRKRDKSQENAEMKKCRARFGLESQARWCKHCRRKKKCLWFREGHDGGDGGGDEEDDSAEEHSPPAMVTSTTHGSPLDASAVAALPGHCAAADTDGALPNGLGKAASTPSDASSSPASVSGVTSTTAPAKAAVGAQQDDDDCFSDDDDDDDETNMTDAAPPADRRPAADAAVA